MAGPAYLGAGARVQSAGAVTLSPLKPTVYGQNGLLVAIVQSKNNAVHATATAGWVKLDQQDSGAGFTASIWTAPEGSASPVFTWTGSVACAARVAYYADAGNVVDAVIGNTTFTAGLTTPHTSASVNTTRDNSLMLLLDAGAANTTLTAPAGWTLDVNAGSATDAGVTTFGRKALAVSGAASGAVSVAGANAAWVQWQIELRGEAVTAGLEASKFELDGWLDPPPGLDASKIEFDAWLIPSLDQLDVSLIEFDAWLEIEPFTGTVHQTAIAFLSAGLLTLSSGAVQQATLAFTGEGELTLGARKDPPFNCAVTPPKTWTCN